ncbi:hypothetical protein [Dyella sp.]|uniref:hypothetical protein n=1 Tax=Dyella sp. TaxID=1869338 RepID=UPI002D784A9D|nr:hypothetical protein [Dyella sp.]HET7331252.1 hypothetical protein [Dyella sp.]
MYDTEKRSKRTDKTQQCDVGRAHGIPLGVGTDSSRIARRERAEAGYLASVDQLVPRHRSATLKFAMRVERLNKSASVLQQHHGTDDAFDARKEKGTQET